MFGQFRGGGLSKETNSKNWGFCMRKKEREETPMVKGSKVLSLSNMSLKNM